MDVPIKKIAAVIRGQRKKTGLSQEKLAEKAEIDRTYVSMIERGKVNLTLLVAGKIAKALGVSLSSLIKKTEH